MKQLTIFVCLFLVGSGICAKLPSSFKKCNRNEPDFNQCLREAVEDAIRHSNGPLRSIGLNSLDPIEVTSLTVASSPSLSFEQNWKNLKLFGFTNITLLNLDMNFETKTLFMDCFFPEIKWEYDYDFDGKIVSVPINGRGSGTANFANVNYQVTFHLREYKKNGEKHFQVIAVKCVMEPETVTGKLENLFDGDKVLGDTINKILEDSGTVLFDEVKPVYGDVFGQIFSILFNRLLVRVPIEELFGTEIIRVIPPFVIPYVFDYL